MSIRLSVLYMILVSLSCGLPLTVDAAGSKKKNRKIKDGLWGGSHISMEVERGKARLQFDCANAEITSRLITDSAGRFELSGRYTQEHGGPVRLDQKPKYQEALFTGTLKGDTLDLAIVLTESRDKVGDFRLKYGQEPELYRCY